MKKIIIIFIFLIKIIFKVLNDRKKKQYKNLFLYYYINKFFE